MTTNRIDPALIAGFMERARALHAKIDSSKGEHMRRAGSLKEDLNDLAQEADQQGIPAKLFKKLIKTQQARAKAEAEIEKLDEDERDTFEMIEEALAQSEFDWSAPASENGSDGTTNVVPMASAEKPKGRGKGKAATAGNDELEGQQDLEDTLKGDEARS